MSLSGHMTYSPFGPSSEAQSIRPSLILAQGLKDHRVQGKRIPGRPLQELWESGQEMGGEAPSFGRKGSFFRGMSLRIT